MKTMTISTKNSNKKSANLKNEEEASLRNNSIWDLEKRGTPTCCICFEIALNPVRIPCRCATLMCLDCFRTFMEGYSACLVCRERIVPRLRRLCKGKGLESLVDVELQSFIHANCCLTSNQDENSLKNTATTTTTTTTVVTRPDLKPPDPGELKQELERLNSRFEKERDEEIKASLALIEELKRTGDDDLLELERLKRDEEIALKLQGFAHQVTEEGKEVITIIEDDADVDGNENIQPSSSSSSFSSLKRSHSTTLAAASSPLLVSSNNKRLRLATIHVPATASNNNESAQSSIKRSLSVPESASISSAAKKQHFVSMSDSSENKNKNDDNNKKTWTCQVCTYAFTERCWLRCDMCKSPKNALPK